MTNGNSAEREAFERAMGGYKTGDAWVIWQKAWRAALSVCADGGKDSSDARDVRNEESDGQPKERLCGGSHIACNGVDYCLGHPSCRDIAKERAEKDKK